MNVMGKFVLKLELGKDAKIHVSTETIKLVHGIQCDALLHPIYFSLMCRSMNTGKKVEFPERSY